MSSLLRDLEDPTKYSLYVKTTQISCLTLGLVEEDIEDAIADAPFPYQWRDLPDGYELRMQSYRAVWTKCLSRVQSIVKTLYAPVAEEAVEQVTRAYTDVLPGLPYPELPVIAVSAESGSLSLYTEIIRRLGGSEAEATIDDAAPSTVAFQAHLYPSECVNTTAMMKAIVTGFVEQTDKGNPKRKPTTSLANYDINLLSAWYRAQGQERNLLIFLHDFEQFDPTVVQDAFYICSLHIPDLPLVFILALSSPPSPLTSTRPTPTFFDPTFEPDIMLGPGTLDFIASWVTRHSASLDALLTILQVSGPLKHFDEPLALLAHPSPYPDSITAALHKPSALPFLAALQVRLHPPIPSDPYEPQAPHAPTLLADASAAHSAFRYKAHRVRVAFGVARLVRRVGLGDTRRGESEDNAAALELLGAVLRGRAVRDVRYLGMAIKKLPARRLRALLGALHAFFDGLADPAARRAEEPARVRVVSALAQLPLPDDADGHAADEGARTDAVVSLAAGLGDWLVGYLEERFVRLDEGALWDVWYTGATPFPAELINPAPRSTIVAALLRPQAFRREYARFVDSLGGPSQIADSSRSSQASEPEDDDRDDSTVEEVLPDTSILFQRYTEAGRMINVYDWFEAFALELEGQRRREPVDARDNGKGKERAHEGEDEEEDEEEEERWKEEVQARFIRALHELDFMGFVKHTGRKADHVMRTVFDLPD
ncbi:hypothetical protein B0H21DRAFT_751611 [Amylocystis lapponica]|nr:hypothetical protein B0H21DRAFT_751611 [Amylocystis lapponica]